MQSTNAVNRSRLQYYIKSIPIAGFNNIYIPINWINESRYISVGIISDDDGIFNLQPVDNQVNNCNNLFLIRYKYNFV